jgi:hypothetical protein
MICVRANQDRIHASLGFHHCGSIVFPDGPIFLGAAVGYQAWQSMDDPPAEAFNDTSVLGALLLGWRPGLLYCSAIFWMVRGVRWVLRWSSPSGV